MMTEMPQLALQKHITANQTAVEARQVALEPYLQWILCLLAIKAMGYPCHPTSISCFRPTTEN